MILVLWSVLAWNCPLWAPKTSLLKPLLCEPKVQSVYAIVEDQDEAVKKAQELGPDVRVTVVQLWYDEQGRRGKVELPIEWRARLKEK